MLHPIRLSIRKKTLVPTKHAIIHKFRSDWIQVGTIDYNTSPRIFKKIANMGPIETEAQFARFLLINWGPGEYYVMAWKKGREGFWNFLKIMCYDNGFWQRLPKRESKEDKELKILKQDYNKLKSRLSDAESDNDKIEIANETNDLIEDFSLTKDINDLEKSMKRVGPSPYLTSNIPVYKQHEYDSWESIGQVSSVQDQRWL